MTFKWLLPATELLRQRNSVDIVDLFGLWVNQKPISKGWCCKYSCQRPQAEGVTVSHRLSYGNRLQKSIHNSIRANLLRLHWSRGLYFSFLYLSLYLNLVGRWIKLPSFDDIIWCEHSKAPSGPSSLQSWNLIWFWRVCK